MRALRHTLLGAALAVTVAPAFGQVRPTSLTLVPDVSLPVPALADGDSTTGIVRINPMLLGRLDPRLALFVVLREQARGQLDREVRAAASRQASGMQFGLDELIELSLQADCMAARRLAERAPQTLAAVASYYASLDDEEDGGPSNATRAKRLTACGEKAWQGHAS
jgi:hypothetical protein